MTRYRALPNWVVLEAGAAEPLYRQIYRRIESAIFAGELPEGSPLPSSRGLAEHLRVSRVTVVNAYDWLVADGLAVTRPGSGIRVARASEVEAGKVAGGRHNGNAVLPLLSRNDAPNRHPCGPPLAFQPDMPALDQFPRQIWSRLLKRCAINADCGTGDERNAGGFFPLRRMIARYVFASRGVSCTASQVIVVGSVRAATRIAVNVLASPGDTVALEDPGYHCSRNALGRLPLTLEHVPVDQRGMQVDEALRRVPHARVFCVTPCQHWPTGVMLAPDRREALLGWSHHSGGWIVEDDGASAVQYQQPVPPPLKAHPHGERVIFIGGFSRTLGPSIGCAYLVVPADLEREFVEEAAACGSEPSLYVQAALSDLMAEGHFTRHVQKLRTVLRSRRDILCQALAEAGERHVSIRPPAGGLQIVADLRPPVRAEDLCEEAAKRNLTVVPLSLHCLHRPAPNAVLLGFGSVAEADIAPAVGRLLQAVRAAG